MPTTGNRWIIAGALFGAAGVAFGAFGAHGLPENLAKLGYDGADSARRIDIFETAARYQMYHAIALVLTGLLLSHRSSRSWQLAGNFFTAGILLFSGLLYALTFAPPNLNWLGAIVPFGGVAFIVGWVMLAVGAIQRDPNPEKYASDRHSKQDRS